MLEELLNDRQIINKFIKDINGAVDNIDSANNCPSINLDILDNEDHFLILIDLPGFNKNEILIEYKNNRLIVSALHIDNEKDLDIESLDKRFINDFIKVFNIGEIKEESIKASYINAILKIEIKK